MKTETTRPAIGSRTGASQRNARQRRQDGDRRPDVAPGVLGIGTENLAAQAASSARLVAHDEHVDDERRHHRDDPRGRTVGTAGARKWAIALRATSLSTSSMNIRIATDAIVSYLRWPCGWFSSAGRCAADTPTSATTFEEASASE